MLDKLISVIRSRGFLGTLRSAHRRLTRHKAKSFIICEGLVAGKRGLEIGGPSAVFKRGGLLPVYPVVGDLDNCNFAHHTLWEGDIVEGPSFRYDVARPVGRQYVTEAADLRNIPQGEYDFILSSHVIEHIANPMKALTEWLRVLKPGGTLVLFTPHKEGTFDHRRPVTALNHLIDDYQVGTGEDDLTHLPEILERHDLRRDPGAGTPEEFKTRSKDNQANRCLHHHVFDTRLIILLLDHLRLKIDAVEPLWPDHILTISHQLTRGERPNNERFLGDNAPYHRTSPFASDRQWTC